MKQVQFHRIGPPEDVVQCVEVPEPEISAEDEVLVRVEAFPVNPADLLVMRGVYPRVTPGSPTLGNEAIGIVRAVGAAVREVAPGDRVVLLSPDNWGAVRVAKERDVVRVPREGDRLQFAGLKVNPATAALLLRLFVDLRPGDWILQNAANSAVGRAAIQIARSRGLRTVNIVRTQAAADDLAAADGDAVLVDGEDLAARVSVATAKAPLRLATDAVAGSATQRLASCLAPGGSLVVYGAMSGEPAAINPGLLVFNDIRLRGFWLTRHLSIAPRPEIAALYAELAGLVAAGRLVTSIDAVFGIDAIRDAVRRAGAGGRAGKVMVTFD